MSDCRELIIRGGHIAIVDAEDYERASKLSWNLDDKGYPRAHIKNGYSDRVKGVLRKRPMVRLHQFVMNAAKGSRYDHEDGNPLNNRKSNLRPCTQRQNTFNRKPEGNRKYKGTEQLPSGSWRASLRHDGKMFRKGPFPSENEAAEAYNKMAVEHFGEFARLNKIEGVSCEN